ncbi:MAG TPA: spore germination protein GerW family protein [Candidatus Dormibacteraeota bacterium]
MRPEEILDRVRDTLTVRQVFGEPYERDGVLVVPVARVAGGGGGGGGGNPTEGSGSGGGFGLEARPVGVYVIRDGEVSWRPAVDVTRIALGGQLVAIVALLVARSAVRRLAGR